MLGFSGSRRKQHAKQTRTESVRLEKRLDLVERGLFRPGDCEDGLVLVHLRGDDEG